MLTVAVVVICVLVSIFGFVLDSHARRLDKLEGKNVRM